MRIISRFSYFKRLTALVDNARKALHESASFMPRPIADGSLVEEIREVLSLSPSRTQGTMLAQNSRIEGNIAEINAAKRERPDDAVVRI